MKMVLVLFIGLAFTGCAATSPFGNLYNQAVLKGKTTTVIREEPFDEIKAETHSHEVNRR